MGIVTARDKLAIRWTADEMKRVAAVFPSRSANCVRQVYGLRTSGDETIHAAQKDILDHQSTEYLAPILYRPFDVRYTWYSGRTGGLIERPREEVMRHMLAEPNVGLITTRQCQRDWSVLVSNTIIGHKALATYDICSLFPLYAYPTEGQEHFGLSREPNLDKGFIEAIGSSLGLEFVSEGSGDLQGTFGPEDVFNYIYAVLHSPEYRRRYADFLKSDFPRIPLIGNRSLFAALVEVGKRLVSLHLMESEGDGGPAFPETGDNSVDRVRYAPPTNGAGGRVFINRSQYFEGVEPDIWDFTIGDYRPAEKWLKDRRSRVLSDNDVRHYRRLVSALADTQRLMEGIDQLIEGHGGWPEAFHQTGE